MSSCDSPHQGQGQEQDALMIRRTKHKSSKICVKCKINDANIVIRHAFYCKQCFYHLITSKFRRSLEPAIDPLPSNSRSRKRTTAITAPGNLLVAFSGGLSSRVLLDLVHRVFVADQAQHQPTTSAGKVTGGTEHPRNTNVNVWPQIWVCYVEMSATTPGIDDSIHKIREILQVYGDIFKFIPVRIEDAFDPAWWERTTGRTLPSHLNLGLKDLTNEKLPLTSDLLDVPPKVALLHHISSLPTPTAVASSLTTITRLLLLHTALSVNASHLLLGTSLTSLSVALLTNIALGGGFAINEEAGETWVAPNPAGATDPPKKVKLVRPLRDIGVKECAIWARWEGLKGLPVDVLNGASGPAALRSQGIEALTKDFIFGLERDYPSTVSTIARTCAKLAPKRGKDGNCIFCARPIQQGIHAWKASISIRDFHPINDGNSDGEDEFDLAPHLCYACQTTFTSQSSRGSGGRAGEDPPQYAADPSRPGSGQQNLPLPIWVGARLESRNFEHEHGDRAELGSRGGGNVAGKKMSRNEMREVLDEFLLE